MKPSAWALRHPIPVIIITSVAVLFGIVALFYLNREFTPSVIAPEASVVTLRPGVAAEDIEQDISSVLENHFASIPGLEDLSSESREGVSIITLKFTEKMNNILQELDTRIDLARSELPDDLSSAPTVITKGANDLAVFSFAVSGFQDTDRITRYVEDRVVPEIYKVDGVAGAETLGGRKLELRITLDVDALRAVDVTALEVLNTIKSRNTALPSGLVNWGGGQWAFHVSGEFTDIQDLENLVIGYTGHNAVRLLDIAEIVELYTDTDERMRSGLQDLVVVQVTKRKQGNALLIIREIRGRLANMENEAEGEYTFTILHDDSQIIKKSLGSVMRSAIIGVTMAIAIIWFFLHSWRMTLVTAVSLPISLVLTFAGMKLAGQSLNVLTMAGITISLGMVVDASIVVLENIHRQHAFGETPEMSALKGSSLISGAVIASTTTSLSVFASMMFLTGIIGIILKDLSLTIVLCLGSSLFAALLVVPVLARWGLLKKDYREMPRGIMTRMEKRYEAILTKALNMRAVIIFTAIAILIISFFAADLMGTSFLPAADYDELFVSLKLPSGSSLEESSDVADRAEAYIRSVVPELSNVLFYVGMENDLAGDARTREAIWGQLKLNPRTTRKRSFREIITVLNEGLPKALPGIDIAVFNGGFDRMVSLVTDGAGFRVELRSESPKKLTEAADRVQSILAADPAVISTNRDITEDRRFVKARLNPDMLGALGINAQEAALTSRIIYDGIDVGEFRPDGGEDRKIRLSSTFQNLTPDSNTLARVPIRNASGRIVSLDTVSTLQEGIGVSKIRHRNRARSLTVTAYTRDENFRHINRRFRSVLEAQPLAGEVQWRLKGVGALVFDSLMELALILVVALFLVYAVMAIQFEKLAQPLIIMASVPFCFIGVVSGLAVFGSDISLIAFLGIITLAGIVVNSAIVQVDRINQLRQEGMALEGAVVKGSVSRLRPILMTTLTTFFGALPLSLSRGLGARIYAPLGQVIAGGLVTSTLVTLILIPVLYTSLAHRQEKTDSYQRMPNQGAA